MKPVSEWTKQEVFDFVVAHLRKQGTKAIRTTDFGSVTCAYRGRSATKCAAGCLIPDELYDVSFEGKLVTSLPELVKFFGPNLDIVKDLQSIHDVMGSFAWEAAFRRLAGRYELTV